MTPVTINLEPAVRGDKWQGIHTIGPILVNDAQPTFPLSRVQMQFRKGGALGMTLDSQPGAGIHPIIIANAATWFVQIPAVQPLPLSPGDWQWDIQFWEGADTAPQTFYRGRLSVEPDVTRP